MLLSPTRVRSVILTIALVRTSPLCSSYFQRLLSSADGPNIVQDRLCRTKLRPKVDRPLTTFQHTPVVSKPANS